MQQFTVPQFIDVEDKIIGPITTRQFLIILAGAVMVGIGYKIFDFTLFLTSGIVTFIVCGVFAFFKVNGMPFHFLILNFTQTIKRPSRRVWNNALDKANTYIKAEETKVIKKLPSQPPKVYTTSRLAELSLIVDTSGAYQGEEDDNNNQVDIRTHKVMEHK